MCVRVVKWIALSTSMVTQVGSRRDTTDLVSLCFFFVSFYFVNGFVFWFTMRSLWLTMILLHSSNDNRISKKPKIWFSHVCCVECAFYLCLSLIDLDLSSATTKSNPKTFHRDDPRIIRPRARVTLAVMFTNRTIEQYCFGCLVAIDALELNVIQ